jgi:hypothetical protein
MDATEYELLNADNLLFDTICFIKPVLVTIYN